MTIKIESYALEIMSSVSLLLFVLTPIILIVIVVLLPKDYFAGEARKNSGYVKKHPLIRFFTIISKNVLGALLVLSGIAMLVLPGQGLLTILIGLTMIDFPGKYHMEQKLIARPAIHRALNKIREVFRQSILEIPNLEEPKSGEDKLSKN